jgi:2-keto-4-pentenoate hydratase
LDDVVESFVAARDARPRLVGVPAGHSPTSIDEGYALQAAVHATLERRGDKRLGYKVGSTSASGQAALGLREPIRAGIFASTRAPSLDQALSSPLAAPSVECEVALVLGADLVAVDVASVRQAIASCHVACEVIDNRYGEPLEVGVPTMLADDFFHAAFVLGPPSPNWGSLDLAHVDAEVRMDGRTLTGNAADGLDALSAVLWLARHLASTGGRLRAGEIILTGAIIPPIPLPARPRELALSIQGLEPLILEN